jgi:type I restriction enzyme S subunit
MPYIGLGHIEQQTLILRDIGSSQEIESEKYRFEKGDILFSKLRPYHRKVIIAPSDGICSTEFSVIRPFNLIDRNFLFYCLAQPNFIKYATLKSKGARPRTKWKLFSDFKIEIENDVAREKIGNQLYKYDQLIKNNNRRIELLEKSARLLYKEWLSTSVFQATSVQK